MHISTQLSYPYVAWENQWLQVPQQSCQGTHHWGEQRGQQMSKQCGWTQWPIQGLLKEPVALWPGCVNWRRSELPVWQKAVLEFALLISWADDRKDNHFRSAWGTWLQLRRHLGYSCHFSFFCHVRPPCPFCWSCSQQRILFDGKKQWCQRHQG